MAELVRVTTVLKAAGLVEGFGSEVAMARGTAVHQCCELIDENDLDWDCVGPLGDSIGEPIEGYLRGWEKFLAKSGFVVQEKETRRVNEIYGVSGTLDRRGMLGKDPVILEIKTGQVQKWAGVQLAAYEWLIPDPKPMYQRWAVELHRDGTYEMVRFPDPYDTQAWFACLTIYRWKEKHGL